MTTQREQGVRRLPVLVAIVAALVVTLMPLPSEAAHTPGGTFTDDDGNFHEGAIEAIAAEGITKGCNPPFGDRYCPAENVDRGAMAAFLRRAIGLPDAGKDFFTDDNGSPFEADINAIAQAGITKGCNPAGDLFCPNDTLRRDEMAAFLRRAVGLPDAGKDFFTDDNGSPFEADINAIAEVGITNGCNPAGDLFCPSRTLRRDEMASFLSRAFNLTPILAPTRPGLGWSKVVGGFNSPIQALAPPGETRLLIAEQGGLIKTFENGSISETPFLNLQSQVEPGGEKGLLSMAVHPDYPSDRRLFVWYYAPDDRTYLVEYDIAADIESASSPRTVLSVAQPFGNHNGGFLAFGDDGYLYLGIGDGGSGNDPGGRARDLSTLLGKMIRIDVDGALPYAIPQDNPYVGKPGFDEIWASGLRNPWRWSFDGGRMYIGDVGQVAREEINMVEVSPVGYDFGWARFEGTVCNPNDPDPSCSKTGLTFPVAEYGRSVGTTVVGGIVYRGPTVRSLAGYYIYADIYSGTVRGFRQIGGTPVEQVDLTGELKMNGIVSFGTDGNGELLVVSLFDGSIYRLTGG
ncbi:MAG: sorbosone dehydrogenase family protein [Acidimicrobiia bacterium]